MPASPTPSEPGSSKRASARQRIEAKRAAEDAAQKQADRRRRRTVLGGVAAGVLVVLALIVVIVVQTQRTSTSDAGATPANTIEDGTAIAVGPADAVTVDLYADFQCPACRQFDSLYGDTLDSLVADGEARLRYRPIAILDRFSSTSYSTRALNAAGVVVDQAGPEAFVRFAELLYDNQPAEGGAGLPDEQLIAFAEQAGASGPEVEKGIRDLVFENWTKQVTEAASRAKVNGTPTVLVDGEPLDLPTATPQTFTETVRDAAG